MNNATDIAESARKVRAELPLSIGYVGLTGPILTISGMTKRNVPWSWQIWNPWSFVAEGTVVAWADDPSLVEQVTSRLVGQEIVALEGPDDLFDATIVLSSHGFIRQISSDEDVEPWIFDLEGNWFFVGLLPAEHRVWMKEIGELGASES